MNINDINLTNIDDDDLYSILDQLCYNDTNNIKDGTIILDDFTKTDEYKYGINGDNANCTECGSADHMLVDTVEGIVVCTNTNCGVVQSGTLDTRPEWKSYDNGAFDKNAGRCSMPTSHFFPLASLGTSIGGYSKNSVKKLQSWSAMPYRERSLLILFVEMETVCKNNKILKCIEDDAKILCKSIHECRHVVGVDKGKRVISRGRNRRSLIAACVYYACRRKGVTRSPKEMAKLFGLKSTEITSGCKLFIKLMKMVGCDFNLNCSASEHFIPRFCYQLNVSDKNIKLAVQIAKNITKLNIASVHTPLSVATGAILIMSKMNNLELDKADVAEHFGITVSTVNKTYDKVKKFQNILVDNDLVEVLYDTLERERKSAKVPDHVTKRLKELDALKKKYNKLNKEGKDEDADDDNKNELGDNREEEDCDVAKLELDDVDYVHKLMQNNIDINDRFEELHENYLQVMQMSFV